jgi:hypothetical protein
VGEPREHYDAGQGVRGMMRFIRTAAAIMAAMMKLEVMKESK